MIKLAANQPLGLPLTYSAIIMNQTPGGGDDGVYIADLTIDGDAANQTKGAHGVVFFRTFNATCERVRVLNCMGTALSGAGENFFFDTVQGSNSRYVNCEAVGTAGTHGSGFSANGGTYILWLGCSAYGISIGNGFTAYGSSCIRWVGCWSYNNANHGFNVEESYTAVFTNCVAGAKASSLAGAYPYAILENLGNGDGGFVLNGAAKSVLSGCHASANSAGLIVAAGSSTAGAVSGVISGCAFVANSSGVIILTTANLGRNLKFTGNDFSGNTTTALNHPTGYVTAIPGFILPVASVPASNIAWINDYPFDVDVYLRGGTGTLVQIDGNDVARSMSGMFRISPGGQLKLSYSSAPSWNMRING